VHAPLIKGGRGDWWPKPSHKIPPRRW
jgi:hypothetical protein